MKQSFRNLDFMQKIIVGALLLFSVTAPKSACFQGVHLGLQVSPNLAFADPRELSHHSDGVLPHFGYGFIFDAMFTDTYAIGTGVNVFYTGGRVQYFELQSDANGERINRIALDQKLQYVEIPLTFKMRTKEIGYTTYFGQFGMGMGLNVRAEGTHTATAWAELDSMGTWQYVNEDPGSPAAISLVDQTLLFRPSFIIGLGLERRFTGTTALVAGIRYNTALRNQYQAFPIFQSHSTEHLLLEYDSETGQELPATGQMQGKTGHIELCIGMMF